MREVRREQWLEIIRDRQNSGETVRGYCSSRGISEKSYYYYQRKLREAACEEMAKREGHKLVEIAMPATMTESGRITVRKGDVEIEIQGNVQLEVVEVVLRVLQC